MRILIDILIIIIIAAVLINDELRAQALVLGKDIFFFIRESAMVVWNYIKH